MSYLLSREGSIIGGSIDKAEASTKDQEMLKVDLNLLLVRRRLLIERLSASSAMSLGITRVNVQSSKRKGSPRGSRKVRKGLWLLGMIQNQKKEILKTNKVPLRLWPEQVKYQKLKLHQKLNQTLMKKMRYFLIFLLMSLKHVC